MQTQWSPVGPDPFSTLLFVNRAWVAFQDRGWSLMITLDSWAGTDPGALCGQPRSSLSVPEPLPPHRKATLGKAGCLSPKGGITGLFYIPGLCCSPLQLDMQRLGEGWSLQSEWQLCCMGGFCEQLQECSAPAGLLCCPGSGGEIEIFAQIESGLSLGMKDEVILLCSRAL